MTPRDDIRHAVARAEREAAAAQGLLDNPTLVAAFEHLERSYVNAFSGSAPDDKAAREAAYFRLGAIRDLRSHLEGVAAAGRVLAYNNRSALREPG